MDPLFRWVLAALVAVGAPFAAIGAWEAVETSGALSRSVRTTGTVVDNRLVTDQRDGNEEHAYVPVVEFHDAPDHVTRFTDPHGSLPADYAAGEAVEVAFEPSEPARARILSWKRLWLVPTLLLSVGLLPGAVGAVVFWRLTRRPPIGS